VSPAWRRRSKPAAVPQTATVLRPRGTRGCGPVVAAKPTGRKAHPPAANQSTQNLRSRTSRLPAEHGAPGDKRARPAERRVPEHHPQGVPDHGQRRHGRDPRVPHRRARPNTESGRHRTARRGIDSWRRPAIVNTVFHPPSADTASCRSASRTCSEQPAGRRVIAGLTAHDAWRWPCPPGKNQPTVRSNGFEHDHHRPPPTATRVLDSPPNSGPSWPPAGRQHDTNCRG
jgi:hypothetical protein